MKLERKIQISAPDKRTGLCQVRSPFNQALINLMKLYPGARWDGDHRVWLFPSELVEELTRAVKAENLGLGVQVAKDQLSYDSSKWDR